MFLSAGLCLLIVAFGNDAILTLSSAIRKARKQYSGAKLQAAGEPGQIKTVQTTPQTGEKEPPDSLAAVTSLGLKIGPPPCPKVFN